MGDQGKMVFWDLSGGSRGILGILFLVEILLVSFSALSAILSAAPPMLWGMGCLVLVIRASLV